jgi:acetolactate synthase small subunit
MKHCLINEDGTILKYNVNKPKVITGTQDGVYLPLEDNVPTIDTNTHRISGSTYEVQSDKVVKTYTVVEIPQEEIIKKKVNTFTSTIDNYIQSKINDYNNDNGVMFANINSIMKYTIDNTYTHFAFCMAIVQWNIDVWETARAIQADVLAGNRDEPTTEELLSELPELTY